MKPITLVLFTAGAVAVSVYALAAFAGSSEASGVAEAPTSDLPLATVERGRYLVHQVGLCIDCHSPRDAKGQWIPGHHLTGSTLPFKPTEPMPWVPVAPKIAGLRAGYTEEQTVTLPDDGRTTKQLAATASTDARVSSEPAGRSGGRSLPSIAGQ